MKYFLVVFTFLFLANTSIQAQKLAIKFVQGGEKLKMKKKNGQYTLHLKPEAFNIEYKHKELMLSAGTSKELFDATKPKIDAAKDYMSNFYIGKFSAFSKDSKWISISGDNAMMFSSKKGAVTKADGTQSITIMNWFNNGVVPIDSQKQVYMTLWLDKNLDLYMDPKETVQVVLNFN